MTADKDFFREARQHLTGQLRQKGIRDKAVLEAIERVPRHLFVSNEYRSLAYEDRPLPIGRGQTISQPFTVAFMTELLQVQPGMKVLEIGTGSGYQTAVLLEMGAKVYTVERIKELLEQTRAKLQSLGYEPEEMIYGNGYEGLPEFAPYDRIIVTAAAPYIPSALVEQLKPGGKMVIPVGEEVQNMYRIIKNSDGTLREEKFDQFVFVPLLPGRD